MTQVTSVDIFPVQLPLRDHLVTSRKAYSRLDTILVRVTADDGTEGWGEARGSAHINGETPQGIMTAIAT